MDIKVLNSVDEALVNQIREVEAVVNAHDGLHSEIYLDNSINFSQDINWLFLAYDGSRLVGVLSIFVPSRVEAEVSALTHPDYRVQGIFKSLLSAALDEIQKYSVPSVLLLCEPASASGKALITHLGAGYDFSEYAMKYDQTRTPPTPSSVVSLRKAAFGDTLAMVQLDQAIFGGSYEDNLSMVVNTLASEEREQYLAFVNETVVGLCCVNRREAEASIFGLGISPEFQGKGYGREMLNSILDMLITEGGREITLDVNSVNDKAFNLYKSSGFVITSCFEYHRLGAEELAQKL